MVLYRLVWCMCTGNALYMPTTAAEQLQYTAGIHSVTQRELTLMRDTRTCNIHGRADLYLASYHGLYNRPFYTPKCF